MKEEMIKIKVEKVKYKTQKIKTIGAYFLNNQ